MFSVGCIFFYVDFGNNSDHARDMLKPFTKGRR